MAEELVKVLFAAASDDTPTRRNAENFIKEISATKPGFGVALTQITLNEDVPLHIRQLGGLILKNYVKEQWDSQCDHLDGRLVTPDGDKDQIKNMLPNGILSSS